MKFEKKDNPLSIELKNEQLKKLYFKLWNQGYVKINSVISKEEASTIKRNFENNLSNL